jgi:CheY-like chemotaxis protein
LRERILIIDDEPLEHRLLDRMVHQLGYVIAASVSAPTCAFSASSART